MNRIPGFHFYGGRLFGVRKTSEMEIHSCPLAKKYLQGNLPDIIKQSGIFTKGNICICKSTTNIETYNFQEGACPFLSNQITSYDQPIYDKDGRIYAYKAAIYCSLGHNLDFREEARMNTLLMRAAMKNTFPKKVKI